MWWTNAACTSPYSGALRGGTESPPHSVRVMISGWLDWEARARTRGRVPCGARGR